MKNLHTKLADIWLKEQDLYGTFGKGPSARNAEKRKARKKAQETISDRWRKAKGKEVKPGPAGKYHSPPKPGSREDLAQKSGAIRGKLEGQALADKIRSQVLRKPSSRMGGGGRTGISMRGAGPSYYTKADAERDHPKADYGLDKPKLTAQGVLDSPAFKDRKYSVGPTKRVIGKGNTGGGSDISSDRAAQAHIEKATTDAFGNKMIPRSAGKPGANRRITGRTKEGKPIYTEDPGLDKAFADARARQEREKDMEYHDPRRAPKGMEWGKYAERGDKGMVSRASTKNPDGTITDREYALYRKPKEPKPADVVAKPEEKPKVYGPPESTDKPTAKSPLIKTMPMPLTSPKAAQPAKGDLIKTMPMPQQRATGSVGKLDMDDRAAARERAAARRGARKAGKPLPRLGPPPARTPSTGTASNKGDLAQALAPLASMFSGFAASRKKADEKDAKAAHKTKKDNVNAFYDRLRRQQP